MQVLVGLIYLQIEFSSIMLKLLAQFCPVRATCMSCEAQYFAFRVDLCLQPQGKQFQHLFVTQWSPHELRHVLTKLRFHLKTIARTVCSILG
jgi:hypothetical protein